MGDSPTQHASTTLSPKPTSLPLGLPPNNPLPPNRSPSSMLSSRSYLSSGGPTPSQLTPNTRSEAEAALSSNSAFQTDSAAPTTPLLVSGAPATAEKDQLEGVTGGRRPEAPRRTTSNYINALAASGSGPEAEKGAANATKSVDASQGDAGNTWKPSLDRQQSWNQQDMKRAMQQSLMESGSEKEVLGYGSATGQAPKAV